MTITYQKLSIETGTEGFKHDPYSYSIYIFENDNKKIEWKQGLVEWLKVNGETIKVYKENPFEEEDTFYKKYEALFKKHTGLDYDQFMKAYEKIKNPKYCPDCGSKKRTWASGFPGETFMVCGDCGKIVDYNFDLEAIM